MKSADCISLSQLRLLNYLASFRQLLQRNSIACMVSLFLLSFFVSCAVFAHLSLR